MAYNVIIDNWGYIQHKYSHDNVFHWNLYNKTHSILIGEDTYDTETTEDDWVENVGIIDSSYDDSKILTTIPAKKSNVKQRVSQWSLLGIKSYYSIQSNFQSQHLRIAKSVK